jgi:hypothetical protein
VIEMKKHIFENICIDFEQILSEPNIKTVLNAVRKQAESEEAIRRTNIASYKDILKEDSPWSPKYFGLFVEWLAQEFLNFYGGFFNLYDCQMIDSEGSSERDIGIDGTAVATCDRTNAKVKTIKSSLGTPIYIQVKGTLNHRKEFSPNDGSRLPNFYTAAMSRAIQEGHAYKARYLIFTTGAGLHYTLENMSHCIAEVIHFGHIRKFFDDDYLFLNKLRIKVGLEPINIDPVDIDEEAEVNLAEEK